MSHEIQQLAYKCRQLKSAWKIHSTLFFNNVVKLKLTELGRIYKIFHVTDIENLLEIDIWRNAIITSPFNKTNQYD